MRVRKYPDWSGRKHQLPWRDKLDTTAKCDSKFSSATQSRTNIECHHMEGILYIHWIQRTQRKDHTHSTRLRNGLSRVPPNGSSHVVPDDSEDLMSQVPYSQTPHPRCCVPDTPPQMRNLKMRGTYTSTFSKVFNISRKHISKK